MGMNPGDFPRKATGDRESRLLTSLRVGGRATTARVQALRVLDATDDHLTATEVHRRLARQMPQVNLSTVYRTLERLESLGLVHRLDHHGEALFGSVQHDHHHALCTRCGRVMELRIDPDAVAALLATVEETMLLRPDHSSGLTVRGVCDACRAPTQG